MRKVLSPSVVQFLAGDKGRELEAIIGLDATRTYWRFRQTMPWSYLVFMLALLFTVVTAAWWHSTLWLSIVIAGLVLSVLINWCGVTVLGLATWRVSRKLGVPFLKCLNVPLGDPERLRAWATTHALSQIAVPQTDQQRDAN